MTAKLLLVDDSRDDRDLAARVIQQELPGVQITSVGGPQEFEAAVRTHDFDLVVTDYQLNWSTGLEVLRRVREAKPGVRVIMFTASGNEETAVAGMKAGLNDYLPKSPRHLGRLAASVKAQLELAHHRQLLAEATDRYRVFFDQSPYPKIVFRRPSLRIVNANESAAHQYGYAVRELIGKTVAELYPDTAESRLLLDTISHTPPGETQTHVQRRSDGRLVHMAVAFRSIPLAGQDVWLMNANDISDRVLAERQLRELMAELEQRVEERTADIRALAGELTSVEQRERRELATAVHDEIGQELAVAKMRLATLERRMAGSEHEALAAEVEKHLQMAIDASRAILARLRPPLLFDVGLVAGIRHLLERMTSYYGVTFDLHIEGHEPRLEEPALITLFQATRELTMNVVKHAKVPRANVTLRFAPGAVDLRVSDSGAGVSADRLSVGPRRDGGFGLVNARERLAMLGGTMEMQTSPGNGTVVHVHLPVHTGEACVTTGVIASDAQRQRLDHPSSGVVRVMLVDDHELVREGVRGLLATEADIEVIAESSDGESAVELARQVQPDLVLMDINMPRMNGLDATAAILREQPSISIVGLTMQPPHEIAEPAREAGMLAVLSKDTAAGQLVDCVRRLAGRRQTAR